MEQMYKYEFTRDTVNLISQALGNLPYKMVAAALADFAQQTVAQTNPPKKKDTPAAPTKNEKDKKRK